MGIVHNLGHPKKNVGVHIKALCARFHLHGVLPHAAISGSRFAWKSKDVTVLRYTSWFVGMHSARSLPYYTVVPVLCLLVKIVFKFHRTAADVHVISFVVRACSPPPVRTAGHAPKRVLLVNCMVFDADGAVVSTRINALRYWTFIVVAWLSNFLFFAESCRGICC